MKIFLHEIKDIDTVLDFTQEEEWVVNAVERVDERADSAGLRPVKPENRPISAHFNLRQVDDVVVISGKIETYIRLLCSRCAVQFKNPAQFGFSALFCKDPVMAGISHLERDKNNRLHPAGQNHGYARHAHDYSGDGPGSEGKDLDITYLSEEFIDLSEVLTEQLQIQVPFQPLCKDECKGMCANCGADLNVGRCACAKLAANSPFAVLKGLKV